MEGGGPMKGNFLGYFISDSDFNNPIENLRKERLKKAPTPLMNRCLNEIISD